MSVYIGIFITFFCCQINAQPSRLETYNVDTSKISVSGLSSGGAMATIVHIAHSGSIMGAGVFAGMPYGCSQLDTCEASDIVNFINQAYDDGNIDNPANIGSHSVYVFKGTEDIVVSSDGHTKIRDYYQQLSANVLTNFTSNAGHGMPTYNYGVACADTDVPGINRCAWKGAYQATQHIYGDLQEPEDTSAPGRFYEYDQSEFFGSMTNHSMDPSGYVYVPSACDGGDTQCRLHVVFHGCSQAKEELNDEYARNTGYNEVGEVNNIIMLYPQAKSNEALFNLIGCWDGVAYTGNNHVFKSGKQVQLVKAMIDRVTG